MAEQPKFTMELDEKLQIIRNHIFCGLDEELGQQMTEAVKKIEPRLKNPEKVRFLVTLHSLSKGTPKGRKILMESFKRPRLYKMAIIGNNPYMKAIATFILVAMGINKVKLFSNEQEAVRWLNE